jgi:hypothetical protein
VEYQEHLKGGTVEEKDKIKPGSTVLVTGLGPSGWDVAKLVAERPNTRIIMTSRHGFIPTVRGPKYNYKNQHLTQANVDAAKRPDGTIPLETVVSLFKQDLLAAYQKYAMQCPTGSEQRKHAEHVIARFEDLWSEYLAGLKDPKKFLKQNIDAAHRALNGIEPLVWRGVFSDFAALQAEAIEKDNLREYVYAHLSKEDKKELNRQYNSLYWAWQVAIPLPTAERIYQLMEEGRLTVESGVNNQNVTFNNGKFRVSTDKKITDEDSHEITADYFVNANSNPGRITDSPLLKKLIGEDDQHRLIQDNEFGGVHFDEHLRATGSSRHLFVIGAVQLGEKRNSPPNSLNISVDGPVIGSQIAESAYPVLYEQAQRKAVAALRAAGGA